MDIGPLSNEKHVPRTACTEAVSHKQTRQKLRPGDTVEISEDGRRKLAELADAALRAEHAEQLSRCKSAGVAPAESGEAKGVADDSRTRAGSIQQVRRRIQTGFYDRPDVREEIADKLIDDMDMPQDTEKET